MKKGYYLLIVILTASISSFGQGKALNNAERFFGIRNYTEALPLFLEAIEAGEKDPMVQYKVGVCYINSRDVSQEIKAIPYLENAIKGGAGLPNSVFYDLGELYLKDENIAKATESFTRFKELAKNDKKAIEKADKALSACQNATVFMSVPRNFNVRSMGTSINSDFTEYNPVVSADESVMAFTALRPNTGKTRSGDKFIESIYISYNNAGTWSVPEMVPVASDYNVGTAGMSPDGREMVIFMGGAREPGSIYVINKSGNEWSKPSLWRIP